MRDNEFIVATQTSAQISRWRGKGEMIESGAVRTRVSESALLATLLKCNNNNNNSNNNNLSMSNYKNNNLFKSNNTKVLRVYTAFDVGTLCS